MPLRNRTRAIPFSLSPPTYAVKFSQSLHVTDRIVDGNYLNIRNLLDDLEVHSSISRCWRTPELTGGSRNERRRAACGVAQHET